MYLNLMPCFGPNKKKIPMSRVTRPYLNLLVKPKISFRFSEKKKNIILCILKGEMAFNVHNYIFIPDIFFKNVCLPYLKFSDPLPETH